MAFSFKIFFDDYQKKKASVFELILVLLLFYPQWKTLKFLYSYWMDHRDEKKLEKDKDDFDRDVSSLEPFLESAIQVLRKHILLQKHQFRYILRNIKNSAIYFHTFISIGKYFVMHPFCNRKLQYKNSMGCSFL